MAHKLKIVLNNTDPKIHRTVIVPENFDFYHLHIVIQCVMNWNNSHLFQFALGAPYRSDSIELKDPDDMPDPFFDRGIKKLDAFQTFLSDYFNGQRKKMNYVYDFGDDWIHTVTVLKKPTEEVLFPKCINGENAAPIDDIGGVWGFYDLLKIIDKQKKTTEEKEMLEWYGFPEGKTFDEIYGFDLDEINERLVETFTD